MNDCDMLIQILSRLDVIKRLIIMTNTSGSTVEDVALGKQGRVSLNTFNMCTLIFALQ